MARRDWFREMLDEPDPGRQRALHARNSLQVKHPAGMLMEVHRRVAQTDPEIAARYARMQAEFQANQARVAPSLAAKGILRRDLAGEAAAEVIGTLHHPSVYYLPVHARHWSEEREERYERWLADALTRQLVHWRIRAASTEESALSPSTNGSAPSGAARTPRRCATR